jgi:hypothetical protein
VQIISTLPPSKQFKARQLIDFIRKIPGLEVNPDKSISYKNRNVPGSNYNELIRDFTLNRPTKPAAEGWTVLATALREASVPMSLIGNKAKLQYINQQGDLFDVEDVQVGTGLTTRKAPTWYMKKTKGIKKLPKTQHVKRWKTAKHG